MKLGLPISPLAGFHVLKFTVEDDGMCLENFHVQVFVKKVIIAVALFNGIPNISRRLRFL